MVNDIFTADEIIAKIGNVIESAIVADVLFTLAADAKVRVNDVDSGFNLTVVTCVSADRAKAYYDDLVAKAVALG